LTGGVPGLPFKENHPVIQIYIAGYQDGSVRIWDATYPALSLVYNIKSEVSDQLIMQTTIFYPVVIFPPPPPLLHLHIY